MFSSERTFKTGVRLSKHALMFGKCKTY